LTDHNIQSAPVYNAAEKQYTGFLDIRDLVSFIRYVYDEKQVQDSNTLHDVIRNGVKMFNTPTTDGVTVTYLSRRNRFSPVKAGSSLLAVVQVLAQGVHRVPVTDEHGHVVNIISQSSVIGFLNSHSSEGALKELVFSKHIKDIHLGTRPVISVRKDTSVIETLRIMDTGRRSGVAIVDEHGRLVGTTTGKDLGLFIKHPTLAALEKPIFKFLSEVRQQQIDIRSPTIGVFEQDTLGRAVGLLVATRIHRIFVTDDERSYRPIAVISITDILRYLLN
jgi:CBS-domain-containing membrane protein